MRGLLYHGWRAVVAHRRELLIVGAMLGLVVALTAVAARPSHGQTIANTLAQVNAQRAARGLYPLLPDIRLQAAAEHDASWRAYRNHHGHASWTPMVGSAEGVGWGSGDDRWGQRFHTCFHSPGDYTYSHRYAGAATAYYNGTTHHTLILRR